MKTLKTLTLLLITLSTLGNVGATVQSDVNNIRAGSNVGTFGSIITTVFNTTGKIKSEFLEIIGALTTGNVPYWNGTTFVNSNVSNTSTGIVVNGDITSTGDVNSGGDVIVEGDINATRICDENGANCGDLSAVTFGSLWNTNGAKVYYNAGNIGIGTNDPGEKLEVVGNIEASGNLLLGGTLSGDSITDNTIDSSEIQDNTVSGTDILNDTIAEADISNSFVARNSNLLDNIDSASLLRSDTNDNLTAAIVVPTANRDEGIFGTYNSTKTQHIWSMGTSYRNSPTGVDFGNLYGLAYKHTNNTTGGTMAGSHQVVWSANGVPQSALGTNIWTSGAYVVDSTTVIDGNAWIIGDRIQQNSIDSSEIADNTITGADILNNTISGTDILDNSIAAADLAANSVTASEIAANAVGASEIVTNGVGSSEIADNSLTATDLAANSVGTSEVTDNSLQAIDLAANSVGTSEVTNNTLTANDLATDSVGALELANDSVGSANVIANSLLAVDLAPNSVGTSEVTDNTLTANDLATDSVGALELANNSVGSANVIADSLTATDLAANSVGASELLDTGNFTMNNLNVNGEIYAVDKKRTFFGGGGYIGKCSPVLC